MKPLVDAERVSGVFDRTVQASTHHDWNTLQEGPSDWQCLAKVTL